MAGTYQNGISMTAPRGSVRSVRYTGSIGGAFGMSSGTTSSAAAMNAIKIPTAVPGRTWRTREDTPTPASTDNAKLTIRPNRAGARSQANIGTAAYNIE